LAGSVAQVPVTYAPRSREQGKKLFIRHGLYCVLATLLMRIGLHHKPLDVEVPRLFRYGVTGLITVGLNLLVLYIATDWFHVWYVASSVIGFVISYAINFSLHKFWTFESKTIEHTTTQLPLHLSLALINLVLNAVLLYALVEYVHVWYLAAQIITAVLIAAESFVLLSRFVFKEPVHE
jgi:putative flippase GtrA